MRFGIAIAQAESRWTWSAPRLRQAGGLRGGRPASPGDFPVSENWKKPAETSPAGAAL